MAGDLPENFDSPLPLATILHVLTIKLSSTNYLLWRNQVLPLLGYQKLMGYIDGTIAAPSPTITTGTTTSPNPAYATWHAADQRAFILIQSSLSEEAMAETLGHTTAGAIWCALEAAYSHDSVERMHTLRDSLRQIKKGSSIVVEFARKFKAICDQLNAIGHPLDDTDKSHWFLGRGYRRLPQCQLCGKEGHYATKCPDLNTFASRPAAIDANLAHAFQAQCNVAPESPDWFVDSEASSHMTSTTSNLDSASTYVGNEFIIFANGQTDPISHVRKTNITPHIVLQDVLVVPHITKNLLSISKLTHDSKVDVLFSDDMFLIQNRLTKETLARGHRKNRLYVLEQGQQ
ncbi:zinc finger, CCHC-type containing LTR copia-type gag-polypeptide, partial [Tanacetum coccineum]